MVLPINKIQNKIQKYSSRVRADKARQAEIDAQLRSLRQQLAIADANRQNSLKKNIRAISKSRSQIVNRRQRFQRLLEDAERNLKRVGQGLKPLRKGEKPARKVEPIQKKGSFSIVRDRSGRVISASASVLKSQPNIIGKKISERQARFITGGLSGKITGKQARKEIRQTGKITTTALKAQNRINEAINKGREPRAGDVFLAQYGKPRSELTFNQIKETRNFINKIKNEAKKQKERRIKESKENKKFFENAMSKAPEGFTIEPKEKKYINLLESFADLIKKSDEKLAKEIELLSRATERDFARSKKRSKLRLSSLDSLYKKIGIPAPLRKLYFNTPDGLRLAENTFILAKEYLISSPTFFKQLFGQVPVKVAFLLASANVNVWEGNYKNALASLKAILLGEKQSRMKGGDAIVEAIKSPETYIFALLGRPRNVRSIPAPRIIKKYRIKIKYTSKLPRAGSIAEPNSIFYDRRTKTVKVTDAKGKVFNAGKLDKLSKTGVSKIREALRKESVKAKKTAKKIKKTINDKKIIEKYGLNPEKLSKELNLKAIENQLSFLRKQADNLKISEIQAKKLGFSGLKELKKYQNTTNKNVIKKINKRVSNRLQKRYEKAVMDLKRKRETANKKRTKTKQKNKIKKEKEVDTSIQQKVEKELGKIKKKELEKIIKENNQAKKQGFKDAVEKRKFLRDSKLAQKGNILAKIRLKLLEKKFKNRKSSKAKNIQKRIKSALNKAEQVFVVRKKSRINKDVAKRLKKVDNRIQKTALQVAPIEYNIKRKIEATRKVNKLGFKNLNEFKRYAKVAEYAKRGDKKALNLIDKLENKRFNNLSKSKGKKVVKKESKELLKSLRDKGAVRERSDKLKQQILKDLKNKEKKPIIIQKGNERVIIKKNKIIKQINIKKPIKSGNTILIQEKWVETKTIKVKPKQKVKQKQKAKQVLKQKSKTIKKRKIATINKRQIKSLSKLNLFKKLRSLLVFKPISKNKINIISKQKIDAKTKNDIKQILDIALKRKTKTKPKQKPKQKQKPKTKTPIPQKTITKTPRTPRTPRTPQIPKIPKRPIIKIPKIKIKKKKGKKIPRGKMQGYVALVRAKGRRINGKYIRGRLVRVSKSLPRNKALKLAGELADKTTSQTIKVIEGNIIKKRKDIKRPKILRKYKKSKSFKNALREKAKARIDTRGEKRGLSLRKALLQRKKKREKAKRRKKRAKKN